MVQKIEKFRSKEWIGFFYVHQCRSISLLDLSSIFVKHQIGAILLFWDEESGNYGSDFLLVFKIEHFIPRVI